MRSAASYLALKGSPDSVWLTAVWLTAVWLTAVWLTGVWLTGFEGGVADMNSTVAPDSPDRPTSVAVLTRSQASHRLSLGVATLRHRALLPNLQ